MELRQLEYFLAVADELHFGKAAKRLHLAEQPLGYQIRKLEGELGFKLFERTTRSVALTPAGVSFKEDAQRILAQSERAADTARRISKGEAGVVRLGYESSTVVSVLPDFVRLFRAEYPEIDLVLVEHSKAGLEPLAAGDTDACLVTRFTRIPSAFEYLPIVADDAVVAISVEHPLAQKPGVSLADLADEPFLGYADASGESANRFMAQLVERAGTEAPVRSEADTFTALLGLVSARLGFTIVTSSARKLFVYDVAYVPLVDPAVSVDYGLALRAGTQTATAETLRLVAEHLKSLLN